MKKPSPKPQSAAAVLAADASALLDARRTSGVAVPQTKERLQAAPPRDAIETPGIGNVDAPAASLGAADAKQEPGREGAAASPAPQESLPPGDLVGLALSGGGIRSATFGLGVVQRLAMLELFDRIDILSTVSGGGYLGAFLSAWIKRTKPGEVALQLRNCPESHAIEPPQVQWLRRYSNYLTPRVGALSLDALTVAATYLRNVLLNVTILTACVSVLVLIPVLLIQPTLDLLDNVPLTGWLAIVFGSIALIAVIVQLSPVAMRDRPAISRSRVVYATVIAPGFLSTYFGSPWLVSAADSQHWVMGCAIGTALVIALLAVVGIGLKVFDSVSGTKTRGPAVNHHTNAGYLWATLLSVPLGFAMLYGLAQSWSLVAPDDLMRKATLMLTAGPPLLISVVALTVTLWIGLMGRAYPEMYREWWSRVGGALIAICIAWIAWCAIAIVIPAHLKEWITSIDVAIWKKGALATGWFGALGSVIGLVRSFSGSSTATKALPPLAKLAALLASIVLVALAIAVACGVHALLGWIHSRSVDEPFYDNVAALTWSLRDVSATPAIAWLLMLPPAWMLLLISVAVAAFLGWRVDINRFSLHDMYKNRLIRCYLGASHAKRAPNLFTGFDPADDIALADLAPFVLPGEDGELRPKPQRPFHIFNTALNLVHGSELSWQERKAALFVLTPTFCGFNLAPASGDKPLIRHAAMAAGDDAREQAFRPTALYADNAGRSLRGKYAMHDVSEMPTQIDNGNRAGFTLGMAMATSGAAVSPNMGANSQPALAMLMTIFNIRLGRWCPNPARDDWRRASPRSNLAWLIAEATGNTNERSTFVYLSDGGHFENTAVYELVRRRCSHIIMVDAGADPARAFEDLGNLIRKCRVDLGAEIKFEGITDLYALADGRSRAGFIRGSVTYAAGSGRRGGRILLIKPTLGDTLPEPADIYNYARSDGSFPQQTTLDQWFDESQFESYRFLGSSLANTAFEANKDFFS